jgi:hypothetical protein
MRSIVCIRLHPGPDIDRSTEVKTPFWGTPDVPLPMADSQKRPEIKSLSTIHPALKGAVRACAAIAPLSGHR